MSCVQQPHQSYDRTQLEDVELCQTMEQSSPPSMLIEYVHDTFSQTDIETQISCFNSAEKVVVIATPIAIVCGYTSQYPIIQGVMKLDLKFPALNACFAAGSLIAYGSLYAWGSIKIFQEEFKKLKPIEASLIKKDKNLCASMLHKFAITVLGFSSTLPNAYYSYVFNNESITWALINITGNWGIMAYSIHSLVQETEIPRSPWMRACCRQPFFEKSMWNQVREFLIMKLERFIEEIPESNTPIFHPTSNSESDIPPNKLVYAHNFFNIIFSAKKNRINADRLDSFMNSRLVIYPVKFFSAILPISNIYSNFKATWDLVGDFTNSKIIQSIAALAATSSSYLTYKLTRDGLMILIKRIASQILKSNPKTLSEISHPKKRIVVLVTASIISLMSSSIDYAAAREIFPDNDFISWFATITSVINCVGLTLLPMLDLSADLLNRYIYSYGTHQLVAQFNDIDRTKELIYFIHRCSQPEFVKLIKCLMENKSLRKEFTDQFPWLCFTESNSDSPFEEDSKEKELLCFNDNPFEKDSKGKEVV